MKRTISLLLALSMMFALCACDSNKFEESYTQTYQNINSLYESSSSAASTIYTVWNIVGSEDAMVTLSSMLSIPSDFDTYFSSDVYYEGVYGYKFVKAFGWKSVDAYYGFSDEAEAKEFHQLCVNFQNDFAKISTLSDTLHNDIKALRSEFGEKHSSEFEVLNEYYLEVSSYAEFAQSPSGTLNDYKADIDNYEREISKLAKAADLY